MGKVGDIFKKSQSLNIMNPQAMHWGMGHYDRAKERPFKNLAGVKGMTKAQKQAYLDRQAAKSTSGMTNTPLSSRYS